MGSKVNALPSIYFKIQKALFLAGVLGGLVIGYRKLK